MTPLVEAKPNPAEMCRPPLHDSVFDAVGELLADDAWGDVTMAEVAARAGVSRQTLYNAFGNREELASAYLLREAERFVAAIEDAVRSNADEPRAALRQRSSSSSRSCRPTRSCAPSPPAATATSSCRSRPPAAAPWSPR